MGRHLLLVAIVMLVSGCNLCGGTSLPSGAQLSKTVPSSTPVPADRETLYRNARLAFAWQERAGGGHGVSLAKNVRVDPNGNCSIVVGIDEATATRPNFVARQYRYAFTLSEKQLYALREELAKLDWLRLDDEYLGNEYDGEEVGAILRLDGVEKKVNARQGYFPCAVRAMSDSLHENLIEPNRSRLVPVADNEVTDEGTYIP